MAFRSKSRGGPAVIGRLIDHHVGKDALLEVRDWKELPDGVYPWTFLAPSGPIAATRCGNPDWPMIIMLPGLTGSKEDFHLMMPILAQHGYQSVSFDLAGQYQSAGDRLFAQREYDWDLFREDLDALLDLTGPAHLIGLSFGGQVAALSAIGRPQDVLSLTLLSSPPTHGNVFAKVKYTAGIGKFFHPRFLGYIFPPALWFNFNRADKGRADFVRHRLNFHNRKSVRDVFELMMDSPEIASDLAASGVPTMIATGTNDLWKQTLHKEFADAVGGQAHFYRTGHSPCETTPNQLCRDMMSLFKEANQQVNNRGAAAA